MGGEVSAPLDIRAAGGVLWRARRSADRGTDGIELAIVHRPRYDDWSLPKGKLHDGEHPLLAAYREVHEETGIVPVVGRRLPQQEYWLGPDRKTVDYWAMSPPTSDQYSSSFTPSDEVDEIRWLRPADAATWLSYDRDRELLRAFLALPLPSSTLLLVRHAQAGERSNWSGEDSLRPLDEVGTAQAEELRVALRCFGPERIFAADNVRCIETVRPLAEELGVPVETEPALTEQAYLAGPDRGMRRIRTIVALGKRIVLCSQGGVIPDAITRLGEEDEVQLPEVSARKGSLWALSFVDGRLATADYYPDLAGG
jgi:8-oxo-(d)GTP phosphatase